MHLREKRSKFSEGALRIQPLSLRAARAHGGENAEIDVHRLKGARALDAVPLERSEKRFPREERRRLAPEIMKHAARDDNAVRDRFHVSFDACDLTRKKKTGMVPELKRGPE